MNDEKAEHRGHALRKGRVSQSGCIYLITAVTQKRAPLFKDFFVARQLVRELIHSPANTLAYVVMPDHVHWLLEIRDASLSRVVQQLKSRSAIAINKQSGRTGTVWQHGYHDHALRKEEDLRETARYIVANPLRAGLVENIGDYPLWYATWL